ncbi:tRNA pseudouridine(55) synthase TruB [bacterium CG2_30_37_16]|nr:MAG: tRNA pseudouridine(55) synthase TruB [bacterium CG2_30_37_16]PIP30506.1 MAG: tRNA pseudouridine(55) synthase TruB [bacterium (Candidatus Howlettbacteria) CG23_combo_of_CG06-09_8_20_14_all_37_9]PIX99391.1 MAG: tRNA pseudouridine(55) synthase TruB [bacterium (Candidatus Howlettbacteria) CG_4_10_14_3_um_filter_37_10]PJB07401.1 MAG: tRNA pseudouridine(55) synthase TruB [bacterium (Candidatus Howlettbacteria) CG_4_9_14_3_um_filter_37_10]
MDKLFTEGIYLIDKPAGRSSFSVVAEVRRKSGIKKVGHAGTLDPFATGLLIVLVGKEYTKKAGEFLKLDKTYEAEIDLSAFSSTGDPEGNLEQIECTVPNKDNVTDTLSKFVGPSMQKPHQFSAVKIEGQRAYKLARAGKEVNLKQKPIEIYGIRLVEYDFPILKIETDVSSGTYIRVLAEDIGKALGCGGYLKALRRTKIDKYLICGAVKLD